MILTKRLFSLLTFIILSSCSLLNSDITYKKKRQTKDFLDHYSEINNSYLDSYRKKIVRIDHISSFYIQKNILDAQFF